MATIAPPNPRSACQLLITEGTGLLQSREALQKALNATTADITNWETTNIGPPRDTYTRLITIVVDAQIEEARQLGGPVRRG